jgi:hypothetical protein
MLCSGDLVRLGRTARDSPPSPGTAQAISCGFVLVAGYLDVGFSDSPSAFRVVAYDWSRRASSMLLRACELSK